MCCHMHDNAIMPVDSEMPGRDDDLEVPSPFLKPIPHAVPNAPNSWQEHAGIGDSIPEFGHVEVDLTEGERFISAVTKQVNFIPHNSPRTSRLCWLVFPSNPLILLGEEPSSGDPEPVTSGDIRDEALLCRPSMNDC